MMTLKNGNDAMDDFKHLYKIWIMPRDFPVKVYKHSNIDEEANPPREIEKLISRLRDLTSFMGNYIITWFIREDIFEEMKEAWKELHPK